MDLKFLTEKEILLGQEFLDQGYVIVPVDDANELLHLQESIANLAAKNLGVEISETPENFLNTIAEYVDRDELNNFRLSIISGINNQDWLRPTYYGMAREALSAIVGNELVMQRRVNMSIQLPMDDSSLLPVHADVWSGDSPFEVVAWLPLVDCFETKSMYILNPIKNTEIQKNIRDFEGQSAEELFRSIKDDVVFLNIPFGNVLVFSPNLLHGNRVNEVSETRWSMNCRFKSVFSPYADKKLGEFFDPITLRTATLMGLNYQLPGGFFDS